MSCNELLQGLSSLLCHRQTFDIGCIQTICDGVSKQTLCDQAFFVQSINQFLKKIIEHIRNNPTSTAQSLSLIILDSLIYNIHVRHCPMEKDNFYASMSASQLSMSASENSVLQKKCGLSYVEALAANRLFFQKIKTISQRNNHKDINRHYIQNLTETIQYVLTKNKLSKETFTQNKKSLPVLMHSLKSSLQKQKVNEIIFSNKLNRILTLINNSSDTVLYALCRIYYAAQHKNQQKHFTTIQFQPSQILRSLYSTYLDSFPCKTQLFQQCLNPIYRLIKCNLQCLYLPVFIRFHKTVITRMHFKEGEDFYLTNQKIIDTELIYFINTLPCSLMQYLKLLLQLIQGESNREYSRDNRENSRLGLIPVKRLFCNCFLFDPVMIQQVMDYINVPSYEKVCNCVLPLFFTSSTRRNTISVCLENKILALDFSEGETEYIVQEPILNYDYGVLEDIVMKLQFTPKDNRPFHVRKISQLIQSPVKIKKEVIQETEDFNLVTWMAVGGKNNYRKEKICKEEHKKNIKSISFNKEKIQEIKALYQKFTNQIEIDLGKIKIIK